MPMAVCNDQSFLVAVLTLGLEALAAVHGTIATGLEGHLGGAAAAVADHFVHLTGAIVVAAVLGMLISGPMQRTILNIITVLATLPSGAKIPL